MKNLSVFQVVLLSVFAVFALVAVLIFSGVLPIFGGDEENLSGEVVIWGTAPERSVTPLFSVITQENRALKVTYVEKSPTSFDRDFIEALASGRGPDLFFLPQNQILRYQDKILPIPYENITARDFKDTYIQESELYLASEGILGLPLTIDPMVMYWNRDIFSAAGVAKPPLFWDEFLVLAPKLSKRDGAGNLMQSAVALGEYRNIVHSKDIIATLFLQVGNPLTSRNSEGELASVILSAPDTGTHAAESALRFFTEWSDPAKPTYSWNRSLSLSRQSFLSGTLGVYFGYASEILDLRGKNPHLNFDVALMPQPRDVVAKVNFGKMNALSVTKSSQNAASAYYLALLMANRDFSVGLAKALYLPPPRRDLLSAGEKDPYLSVFYQAALTARGWLDPSPEETDRIFGEAVDTIVSGRSRVSEAVSAIDNGFELLLQQ